MLWCTFMTKWYFHPLILKSKYQVSIFSLYCIIYNLCMFCIYQVNPQYQAVQHPSHFHFLKIAPKEMLRRGIRGKCISISKALFNQLPAHRPLWTKYKIQNIVPKYKIQNTGPRNKIQSQTYIQKHRNGFQRHLLTSCVSDSLLCQSLPSIVNKKLMTKHTKVQNTMSTKSSMRGKCISKA